MKQEDTTEAQQPTVASLLSGIVKDARDLFSQELAAAKLDIEADLRQQKYALLKLGVGGVVSGVGGALLAHMVVYALAAHTQMPLWSSYGIVGGVIIAVGVMLCART